MKVAKLGEICEMYQPKTISTKEMVSTGKYTVFGANGAIGKYDKYNHESPQLLVTCRGATCGSVNISEPFSWINGNAMVIKPIEDYVTFDYLKYAFLGGINVSGAITGSAQPQITRTSLEQILIPIPSIDYQCIAVDKLDKAFAEIDSLEKNLQLKEEKTNQLLQSMLNATFTNTEKFDMKVVKLGEIFRVGSSKRVLKAEWKQSGVPFYRGREITRLSATGFVNNELYISESHFKALSENYGVPIAGDIMITAIGTIGNSYIVREQDRFYFKDASVLWLHKKSEIDSNFVNYWIKSDLFFMQLEKGNGATVDTLTIETLSNLHMPLPDLSKQNQIVEILNKAFAEINKLKNQISIEKDRISSLRQSILSNSFNFQEKVA